MSSAEMLKSSVVNTCTWRYTCANSAVEVEAEVEVEPKSPLHPDPTRTSHAVRRTNRSSFHVQSPVYIKHRRSCFYTTTPIFHHYQPLLHPTAITPNHRPNKTHSHRTDRHSLNQVKSNQNKQKQWAAAATPPAHAPTAVARRVLALAAAYVRLAYLIFLSLDLKADGDVEIKSKSAGVVVRGGRRWRCMT